MGRLIEYDDEDQEIMFGSRRAVTVFCGTPEETMDFWDARAEELEAFDHRSDDLYPGERGYRHRCLPRDQEPGDDWN